MDRLEVQFQRELREAEERGYIKGYNDAIDSIETLDLLGVPSAYRPPKK